MFFPPKYLQDYVSYSRTHPVMRKEEEENIEVFSERVRSVFAEALNVEKTEFTAVDVAEYRKRLKVSREQSRTG